MGEPRVEGLDRVGVAVLLDGEHGVAAGPGEVVVEYSTAPRSSGDPLRAQVSRIAATSA
ncbi:hypothetical protein ACTXJ3_12800 [Brachybacterium paraconglomeratum]|uniref:hypothetical protein n=1 Tax=Brachybacterium paraconglomeratum TaxID=173362 RepID=UPI003FD56699